MQLFMCHIVSCLHFIERDNIFFSSCVSSTQFLKKNLVCVFLFISTAFIFPQNCFSQNLFCFSYFYRGSNFFNVNGSQGELSLFSLTLLCMFSIYLLIKQSLSIRDKKGERQLICGNPICFVQGELKLFLVGGDTMFVFVRGRYIVIYVSCFTAH